ncbi:hypothetical protein [Azotobacter vinelandii]|uniref:hypothetical protein n=1 Tax=Azotobacter vinelandii TaxID=354 RepID=UPI00077422C8|nr:hypothetical protein [Azotobacter vinelandii]
MNGPLMLVISILVYLILSAMVMDLLMELIAHVLQGKTGPDPEDNANEPRPITPQQDERRPKTLPEHAPDTRLDDSPCLPPASGPPDSIPVSAWLFPLSDYVLGVIAVTRFRPPAILPARSGPFLYLITRRPYMRKS